MRQHRLNLDIEIRSGDTHVEFGQRRRRDLKSDKFLARRRTDLGGKTHLKVVLAFFRQHQLQTARSGVDQRCLAVNGQGRDRNVIHVQDQLRPFFLEGRYAKCRLEFRQFFGDSPGVFRADNGRLYRRRRDFVLRFGLGGGLPQLQEIRIRDVNAFICASKNRVELFIGDVHLALRHVRRLGLGDPALYQLLSGGTVGLLSGLGRFYDPSRLVGTRSRPGRRHRQQQAYGQI